MRIDPIQPPTPDIARGSSNIQNLSSSPEYQLHQPEADSTVNAAVFIETERKGNTRERASRRAEVSYDSEGRAVVQIVNDRSGEVVLQVPTQQVLSVAQQIEDRLEEERRLDLRS